MSCYGFGSNKSVLDLGSFGLVEEASDQKGIGGFIGEELPNLGWVFRESCFISALANVI